MSSLQVKDMQKGLVKEKHIALGLIEFEGKFLLLQRRDSMPMWDRKWEYPGGKIGEDESPAIAVCREVLEETGLHIENPKPLGVHLHDWTLPGGDVLRVHLHCFLCRSATMEVRREEGKTYAHAWVRPEEIWTYDLLEANADLTRNFLLRKLGLRECYG